MKKIVLRVALLIIISCTFAFSQSTENVLHAFAHGRDGNRPVSPLIFDSTGNAYGVSASGGMYAKGTLYEMTRNSFGGWNQTIIHTFTGRSDGGYPESGLIFDSAGNLYGTTSSGGNLTYCEGSGCGTIFKLTHSSNAWTETVIYTFKGYTNNDGAGPIGNLVFDPAGNLYGTTPYGGSPDDQGTVFEISPFGNGWTETLLYVFTGYGDGGFPGGTLALDARGNLYGAAHDLIFEVSQGSGGRWTFTQLYTFTGGADGGYPNGGLIFDGFGNLYGTTAYGGNLVECLGQQNNNPGCGTVFELSPGAGGWTESVLYRFVSGSDGANPTGGVIFDMNGNLYGTTEFGGKATCEDDVYPGCGTVFELSPGSPWKEILLHTFTGNKDGGYPSGTLIFDAVSNLYGVNLVGGTHGIGAVFSLAPTSGGNWTGSILHNFSLGGDGYGLPYGGLIFDALGNIYGTTYEGGTNGNGSIFELTPRLMGGWTETVLYSFVGGSDGYYPASSLVFDTAGNLFGTTYLGGKYNGGTAFELFSSGGVWQERILHSFGNSKDGIQPSSGLTFDAAGNLYGETELGGIYGAGTVFKLTPIQQEHWAESYFSFDGSAGSEPRGNLIFDEQGNVYGTAGGGPSSLGTVFEVTTSAKNGPKMVLVYAFANPIDGKYPVGSLVFDSDGNLYGTTQYGGTGTSCNFGCGTVFELSPGTSGWTENILYSFAGGIDGSAPYAGLVFDSAGNAYGTTYYGGPSGAGTIFQLAPNSGAWSEKLLHGFAAGQDGAYPSSGLILDPQGNLYGTARSGGVFDLGVIFEVVP